MRRLLIVAGLYLMLGLPQASHATGEDWRLTAERVFADPDLSGPTARGVTFSPDGRSVTYLQPKATDQTALDLWIVPTDGRGAPRMIVDSAALEAKVGPISEAERARRERQRIFTHGVVEYRWNDQGTQLLVPVAGELYVADPRTGTVERRVARNGDVDATDSRFSPKGEYISFVRSGTVFVTSARGGAPRAITPSGEGAVQYGAAEFVAQEEFARDTGYWWSPDDRAIAYTRVDESHVTSASWADVGEKGATVRTMRFPFTGTENARVDLFVQPLVGDAPVRIDLGTDPHFYLTRVHWSVDGRTLYVQKQSRDQQTLELIAFDPKTGQGRVLLTERQKPWVNIDLDFTPLADGGFLWVSERSGFRHLYIYDAAGRLVRQVTSGDWPLAGRDRDRGIVGVDERRGIAYVLGFRETPTEQHLYAVNYRSGGPLTRITSGAGWWTVSMNRSATAFIGSYSSPDTPPRVAIHAADGQRLRWLVENKLDAGHPYAPYVKGLPKPEFGRIAAEDGQALEYVLLKPADFDPAKRYPVIVQVYGGPGRQKVVKNWRTPEERIYLDAGFLLFQLDNRGTLNRGLAFEAPIAGKLGTPEVTDQIAGMRYLQTLPYVDPRRIGVTGWSYGGYMTIRMMTHPDSQFAAGAAGAPVTNWHLYDTHYTEHYMGKPQDNAAAYDAASLVPRLDQLRGRLLYMHGLADDNVLFDNGALLIARLQQLSIPFDLMVYPGQRHSIIGPEQKLHLWRTYLEFFKRNLGAPEPH
ncbi:S9 family peptidase [Sphingobium algorifonticola]|uniref:S9 family peptidase n=1 Tax=Sphingobium algorifonticola TaxID=2008318 RepID=A0A437J639_9SPHN|nr:S9 family peptidase [Sphingobium algorifonticola]RVT40264.1 S9 family peptidase [Sphingobium algorifonticola]